MAERIAPHDPAWAAAFADEAGAIRAAAGDALMGLDHIGSTAVPGLYAKPIIDMLGEAASLDAIDHAAPRIAALGYQVMGEFGIEGRRYFRKDDANGARTHHLHVYETGSPHLARHLLFRDYLRAHPDRVTAYSQVKQDVVAGRLSPDLPYAQAKSPFVQVLKAEAKAWDEAGRPWLNPKPTSEDRP